VLGPGLITGASDDDPSGIATYSQVGAQFGYGLAWTLVISYPLLAAIQEISARIGRVTGFGIAGNLRRHYPPWLGVSIVVLLLLANLINLGADLGAMGAALTLLIHGPALLYVALFGVLSAGLQIFTSYARYIAMLKYLCLALCSYVICAFVVKVTWTDVAWAIVWPPLSFDAAYLMAIVAVLGTTISPYLLLLAGRAGGRGREGARRRDAAYPRARPGPRRVHPYPHRYLSRHGHLQYHRIVHRHHHRGDAAYKRVTDIQSSAQAAEALRAVAGPFTFALFAAGIIGTGMLALPALAGSAAYALGETLSWHVGLARLPLRAKAFYATIAVGMALGVALNFSPIDPIRALYWSAVLNGVVAVPVMIMMMRLTMRPAIMASFTLPRPLQVMGWVATAAMAATVVAMVASWLL
jgi:Mn2+/Fe2+ NRAMP family transporter